MLAWGDEVEVDPVKSNDEFYEIKFDYYEELSDGGYERICRTGQINAKTPLIDPQNSKILKFGFVDVQQGDGIFIETPKNRKILIDGGNNQLFARYLASRYAGTSSQNPLEIDAITVTHGDEDHYKGLIEIYKSETNKLKHKQLYIHPHRIFHNGIVKGPSNKKVDEIFGKTVLYNNKKLLVDLVDDITSVPETRLNVRFQEWVEAINHWKKHGPIDIKRLETGDDDEFSFLKDENIIVNVLAPKTYKIDGQDALPLLKNPPTLLPRSDYSDEENEKQTKSYSASHTINGHSLVLKIQYGNVKILLTGDLNDESEKELSKYVSENNLNLQSEIFKVPHHGSHDFSSGFLRDVSPVVSIISSGDENEKAEHIHPRASLVGSLGRNSAVVDPLIFITELVAFFKVMDFVTPEKHIEKNGELVEMQQKDQKSTFFAFKRTAFGIVNIRTDGNRILVFTHSGKQNMKEAYAFTVDEKRKIEFQKVKKL